LHLFYSLFFQLDLETGVLYKTVEGILAIIGKEDALVVAYFLLYHGMRQVTCVLYMLINSSYQHLFMICVALVDFWCLLKCPSMIPFPFFPLSTSKFLITNCIVSNPKWFASKFWWAMV
jgi:hypothetical protein